MVKVKFDFKKTGSIIGVAYVYKRVPSKQIALEGRMASLLFRCCAHGTLTWRLMVKALAIFSHSLKRDRYFFIFSNQLRDVHSAKKGTKPLRGEA
jgi:hypothetical protein